MRSVGILLTLIIGVITVVQLPGCKNSEKAQEAAATLSSDRLHQLFIDNFTPFLHDMEYPTVKGKYANALDQFNIEYWSGRYQDAVNDFQHIEPAQRESQSLKFRYANALLANGQFEDARIAFQDISNHGPSLHANEAVWYLSLIEMYNGNVEKARALLKAYQKSMNPLLGRQADNLLKELGK